MQPKEPNGLTASPRFIRKGVHSTDEVTSSPETSRKVYFHTRRLDRIVVGVGKRKRKGKRDRTRGKEGKGNLREGMGKGKGKGRDIGRGKGKGKGREGG